ncbi:stage III sporulation protein AA [Natronincola ferrireducens]|uniref:Stage III sporulation protein AA n=1 Tax=Natronincola ferrireducens TaxID=393762 RepID=A0A1G9CIQ6_9FIRM|nr:stage III sporulation protein AA [Natronincola ferrireducens]SDK51537.1 stage III sporulation protein AA [Natronincola ferrireducens]
MIINTQHKAYMYKNAVANLEGYLCPEIREIIGRIPQDVKDTLEEIRLRVDRPLMIYGNNEDFFINRNGQLLKEIKGSHKITRRNIENTLQFITNYSVYSVEEELKRGYITIEGGHRVGVVGKVLYDNYGIKTIKDITGLNIRISREKLGVASSVLRFLINSKGEFMNTLIISPPQCGKTTLLRDIIKNLSNGVTTLKLKGLKVGLVDERSEIAACFQGIPQNDLGNRTDILDACPKPQGMMMLIRAMSPEVIATDEIGKEEDSRAIQEALLAGIKLITTVHGSSLEDILSRKVIGQLVKEGVFERLILMSNRKGVGTIEKVLDGHSFEDLLGKPIENKVVG